MKKFLNGKYIEMTEEDRVKSKKMFELSTKKEASYEDRIAELEKKVANLIMKLQEKELL